MSAGYTYDLAVCWRVYPGISKSPVFFADDKYKLAALSFRSFVRSASGLRIKYIVLLDGCPPAFERIFSSLIPAADLELIHTAGAGNLATFQRQLDILSTQTDAELVYFAEDDYLYRPDAFPSMVRFMQENADAEFITPYDHHDHYTHPIHRQPGMTRNAEGMLWKTVVSTTLTFLTRRSTLLETKPVFETYCKGNTDCSMWILLTRTFSIGDAIRFYFTDKTCFFILKKAMKFGFRVFQRGKQYQLWCPVPAVGTHLEKGLQAPGVDWQQVKELTEIST